MNLASGNSLQLEVVPVNFTGTVAESRRWVPAPLLRLALPVITDCGQCHWHCQWLSARHCASLSLRVRLTPTRRSRQRGGGGLGGVRLGAGIALRVSMPVITPSPSRLPVAASESGNLFQLEPASATASGRSAALAAESTFKCSTTSSSSLPRRDWQCHSGQVEHERSSSARRATGSALRLALAVANSLELQTSSCPT